MHLKPIASSISLLLVAVPGMAPAASAQCADAPAGLVAHWSGDGTTADSLGGPNVVLLSGAGFAPGFVSLGSAQAFHFDGVNDRSYVPASSALNVSSATIQTWLKLDSAGTGAEPTIAVREGVFGLRHTPSLDPRLIFYTRNEAGTALGSDGYKYTYQALTSPTPIPIGVWTHLAGTYDDATGTARIFMNGALVASQTVLPGPIRPDEGTSSVFWLGGAGTHCCDGLIDDVQFFGRALEPTEIQAIWLAGPASTCGDSDGDGLADYRELLLGTFPQVVDTDADGLDDGDEVHVYLTDPLSSDTDGDGLSDGEESALQEFGCPDARAFDTDVDGLSDGLEIGLGFDPCDDADYDGDSLMDGQEILDHGTDPTDPDSDDDGILDGTEVDMAQGTGCPDPLNPDSDGDGLLDGDEVDGLIGRPDLTNPCSADTDGDSIPDAIDPLPTSPTGTEGFIADDLRTLCDYVAGVDLTRFLAPNSNAAKGRRGAICNKLNAAANATSAGDIQDAIDQLQSLRQKLDELPDPGDWMVPGTAEIDVVRDWLDVNVVLLGYL
jgi:hypothetical protein